MGTLSKYEGFGPGTISDAGVLSGLSLLTVLEANLLLDADLFSTVLTRGTGQFTPPAIGDSNGDRLVADFEGIWRPLLAEQLAQYGLRTVTNLISFSEDMTQAAYNAGLGVTVDSATQVTYDGTDNADMEQTVTIEDKGAGRTFIYSVDIRLVSGTISSNAAVQLRMDGSALTTLNTSIGDEVTSTPKRFTMSTTTDASGTAATSQVRSDDAITLEITEWQLEESTGSSLLTTPSEYVSTGVSTGPEEVSDPDFATPGDWTTDSGCTVSGGSASWDGTAGSVTATNDNSGVLGRTYLVEYTVANYVGGTIRPKFSTVAKAANGTFKEVVIADNSQDFKLFGTAFEGDVTEYSTKQIDHGQNV